ncbi:MAG TPA: hypothetical protein VFP47_11395, partial [Pyrinomonadaceae bacterium]|nr:hypothetical protein [Pyrinomonadaceae bacterium]
VPKGKSEYLVNGGPHLWAIVDCREFPRTDCATFHTRLDLGTEDLTPLILLNPAYSADVSWRWVPADRKRWFLLLRF